MWGYRQAVPEVGFGPALLNRDPLLMQIGKLPLCFDFTAVCDSGEPGLNPPRRRRLLPGRKSEQIKGIVETRVRSSLAVIGFYRLHPAQRIPDVGFRITLRDAQAL